LFLTRVGKTTQRSKNATMAVVTPSIRGKNTAPDAGLKAKSWIVSE
jgi:hypothetical protein